MCERASTTKIRCNSKSERCRCHEEFWLTASNDLFFFEMESEICNFADDTTVYACDTSIEAVMIRLESDVQR